MNSSSQASPNIVLLCSACFSTTAIYQNISKHFSIQSVIEERPMRGKVLAIKRAKKLGWFRVGGQAIFSFIIVPLLKWSSNRRTNELFLKYGFDSKPIPEAKVFRVQSVNDMDCIRLLQNQNPDVVIVNGTRIISKQVLESTNAVFINMHTGITPKYRGVHGGYWAMVNKEASLFGVTIHLVDKGIDTGGVLYQAIITADKKDNFYTYPFLQLGAGLPLLVKAVDDFHNARLIVRESITKESQLWYHPTIWGYLHNFLVKRIR